MSADTNPTDRDLELLRVAHRAMENAHSPYSGVRVGAAVLTADGQVYPGVNVENASLGLTVCAERVAVWNAVAHGSAGIQTVALTSNHERVASPCGACRQVLLELAPGARIIFGDEAGPRTIWDGPQALLPDAFGGDWKD